MHVLKPRTNKLNKKKGKKKSGRREKKIYRTYLQNTQKIFIYIYIKAPFEKNGETNYAQNEASQKIKIKIVIKQYQWGGRGKKAIKAEENSSIITCRPRDIIGEQPLVGQVQLSRWPGDGSIDLRRGGAIVASVQQKLRYGNMTGVLTHKLQGRACVRTQDSGLRTQWCYHTFSG